MMQGMLMDMLRALATPNMDIRKKTLDIALDLINQHNIDEVPYSILQGHPLPASQKSSLHLPLVFMSISTHSGMRNSARHRCVYVSLPGLTPRWEGIISADAVA